MKRILLSILVVGNLLLSACGAPATAPQVEAPVTPPPTEQHAPSTYTLSVSVSPSGAGSVSPPDGQYDEGTQVTLTATAASGYVFDHWSGDVTGASSSVTITMDRDKSVTAHFTAQYALNTSVSPSGSGTVSPASDTYDEGIVVTLTAKPASGYRFDHWSGAATGTSSPVTIIMDSDKSVVAHFKAQYTLSTSVNPSGGGTIDPASGTYDAGTEVTITATPAKGYVFDHWGGNASGGINPITITMSSNKELIAYFAVTSWTISAEEAQRAVQDALDVISNMIGSPGDVGWPKLPNGADVPKNGQAGTPKLVERKGVPAYEVPVLTSSGRRVGEIYVKQIQSTKNQIEFIDFGRLKTEHGRY